MNTKHAADEVPGTKLRPISHGEVARIVRRAELMRAEHVAGLFRSLACGVAYGIIRLARTLAAQAAPIRPARDVAGEP
jgi:hypothetical protein